MPMRVVTSDHLFNQALRQSPRPSDARFRLVPLCLSLLIAAMAPAPASAERNLPNPWQLNLNGAPSHTGAFSITFTRRTPFSQLENIADRFNSRVPEQVHEYDITSETFEAYIPKSYQDGVPYGLIVWISPSDSGAPPVEWQSVLERHNLLWVGANDAGDDQPFPRRCALALDSAASMARRYTIDPQRVYLAGLADGARCASAIVPTYGSIFRGGIYMGGAEHFRAFEVPPHLDSTTMQAASFPQPSDVESVMVRNRFVFLTGSRDEARGHVRGAFNAYIKDGARGATYLDVPGLEAHDLPDTAWFDRAVVELDRPLTEAIPRLHQEAIALARDHHYGEAWTRHITAYARGGVMPIARTAKLQAEAIEQHWQRRLLHAQTLIHESKFHEAIRVLKKLNYHYSPLSDREVGMMLDDIRVLQEKGFGRGSQW